MLFKTGKAEMKTIRTTPNKKSLLKRKQLKLEETFLKPQHSSRFCLEVRKNMILS